MADVSCDSSRRTTRGVLQESGTNRRRLLHCLGPKGTHVERVQAYSTLHGIVEQGGKLPRKLRKNLDSLWGILQQDLESSTIEIASDALRTLGCFLRNNELPDTVACSFLERLLALITTTSEKRVCTLGLSCLCTQNLNPLLLVVHIKTIIATVVHGIENPWGSRSTTHEAFQALTQLTKQLPNEMRNGSLGWASPVLRQLLHRNPKHAEYAVKFLSEAQGVLLPPVQELSQVVVTNLHTSLLLQMISMVSEDGRAAVIVVNAWGWFIKLIGEKSVHEKPLINEMLKILETSFVSACAEVRNASQVAWVSIIDALVPREGTPEPRENIGSSRIRSTEDLSSHKQLKLLMTPLLRTMSWERDMAIQRNCCHTWVYLLRRLGMSLNDGSTFDAVVLPMLETVFKLGLNDTDENVWRTCVGIVRNLIAPEPEGDLIFQDPTLCPKPFSDPLPKTHGDRDESHHEDNISSSWRSDRVGCSIKLVKLLWSAGLVHPVEALTENQVEQSFNFPLESALVCWRSLVQGVEAEERSAVRPSRGHVTAVHLLLEFFSWVCNSLPSRGTPLAAAWQLADTLIEVLRPVNLASSFYRIRLPLAQLAGSIGEDPTDAVQESSDMVTPIVYISASWFKLLLRLHLVNESDDLLLQRVKSLVSTGRSGFDVIGNFNGFSWVLDCLAKESFSHQEEGNTIQVEMKSEHSRNDSLSNLLDVWRTVADQLGEHVDTANGTLSQGYYVSDSEYKVISNLLLFPITCFSNLCLQQYNEQRGTKSVKCVPGLLTGTFAASETKFHCIENTWRKLYDSASRLSSLKSSSSNAFFGGFFNKVLKALKPLLQQRTGEHPDTEDSKEFNCAKVSSPCLRFLGDIVVHAITHAEVPSLAMLAISRKRRKTGFRASSVRVQYVAGMDSDDANHLRDLLTIASKLLTVSHDKYKLAKKCHFRQEFVTRLLKALAGIAPQISSQNDATLLLQALAQSLTRWLSIGAGDQGRHSLNPLFEALTQAWDGLLSCLQTCRPCLTFDSALLSLQAPTLSLAFVHKHEPIASRTVSFWEETYGSRAFPLKYPPALVEVFCKLKQRVDISLPGWATGSVIVKEKVAKHAATNYSRHPLARFILQGASQERHRFLKITDDNTHRKVVKAETKPPDLCQGAPEDLTKATIESLHCGNLESMMDEDKVNSECPTIYGTPDGAVQCTVRGREEQVLPLTSEPEALQERDATLEDFMTVVYSALKKMPEEDSPKLCSPPIEHVQSHETWGGRMLDTHTKDSSVDFVRVRSFRDHGDEQATNGVQESQGITNEAEEIVGDGRSPSPESISVLITPPVTFNDIPSLPPKIPAGGERPPTTKCAQQVEAELITEPAIAHVITKVQQGSKLPRRRKKLKFHDDSQDAHDDLTHRVLRKKSSPLPDKQNDVPKIVRNTCDGTSFNTVDSSRNQSNDDSLPSQAGANGRAEGPRSCKENISSNLLQDTGFRNLADEANQTEKLGCPSDPLEKKHFPDKPSNKMSKTPNLLRLKERLGELFVHDTTLTFRQIVRQEQCDTMPSAVLRKLKVHLDELKSTALPKTDKVITPVLGELNTSRDVEAQVLPEAKSCLHLDGVKQSPLGEHDGQQVRDGDEIAAPLQYEEVRCQVSARGKFTSYEAAESDEFNYVQIPACRESGRKLKLRSQSPRLLNLRSSGRLRDGKNWRIDAELKKPCTLRPGRKKVLAKRQRSLDSVSESKHDDKVSIYTSDRGILDDNSFRRRLKPSSKAYLSKVLEVDLSENLEVSRRADHLDSNDASFRIRKLDRGSFALTDEATEIGEAACEWVDVKQTGNEIIRLSHSRKCRFPKRVHRSSRIIGCESENSLSAVRDGNPPDEELPSRKALELYHGTSDCTLAAVADHSGFSDRSLIVRPASPVEESQLEGIEDHRNSQQQQEIVTEFPLPSDKLPMVPFVACCNQNAEKWEGTHNSRKDHESEDILVLTARSGPGEEKIEQCLYTKSVNVRQVLTVLASSSWEIMGVEEVREAEKLVAHISKRLGECEGSESPTYGTPLSCFSS